MISPVFSCINRNILECKYCSERLDKLRIAVLIETYWNVKLEDYREIRAMQCGINRNILECKGRIRMVWPYGCLVLIETYWNVKLPVLLSVLRLPQVLIETYWNVKLSVLHFHVMHILVLIETYWNVKASRIYLCNRAWGINRNILECKGAFRWWFRRSIMVS